MPLDPSIILRDISPKFEPYENVLAKQMQIKAQQQQYDDNAFKLQQDRETSQQQNALAQLLSRQGFNPQSPEGQAELYGAGGVAGAQKYLKGAADIGKTKAETDAKSAELEAKVLTLHRDALAEIQNPQDMAKWMVAIRKDPRTQSFYERMGSAEEAIARIPQTPQEFNDFRNRIALGMTKYTEQNAPKYFTNNLGDRTVTIGVEGMTGKANQVNSSANGQSPDNKASNERMALDNAESRKVQMRGQNMVDARTRERLNVDAGMVGGDATQVQNTKKYGKAPAGYRWLPDGGLEAIPGGPTDRKAQEQTSGKDTVDSVVAGLRSSYNALDSGGGITSTNKGALSNISAAVSRTGAGQVIGGALGTKNQKERDAIAQSRPLLLQAIMKATGMSAKQMDSNAELKLYLATATDPTLSLEANKEALDRIEKLYGSGSGGRNMQRQTPISNGWGIQRIN